MEPFTTFSQVKPFHYNQLYLTFKLLQVCMVLHSVQNQREIDCDGLYKNGNWKTNIW